MTALSYTSGTAISAYMVSDGQTLTSGGSATCVTIASAVNERLESYVQRPIGPAGTAARTYDGDGSDELWIPEGVNAITQLRISSGTGGTWSTMGSTEYVLRPASHKRPTGWPAFYIKLTDAATTYLTFTAGFDTVEVTPGTATTDQFGWPAIPTELTNLATIWGVRLYQNRQGGEAGQTGSNDFGASVFAVLTDDDWEVLNRYRFTVAPTYVGGR